MQKRIVLMMASIFGLSAWFGKQDKQKEDEQLVKIGIVVDDERSGLFYEESTKVFKEAAQNRPQVEVLYQNINHDFDKQKQQVEYMIQAGAKALIIQPTSRKPDELKTLVNIACRAGVPAIYFNRDPGGNLVSGCSTAYFVGVDEMKTGIMQALHILRGYSTNEDWDKNQDDSVQYAVLLSENDAISTEQRLERLQQTLQHYPDIGRGVELVTQGQLPLDKNQSASYLNQWISQPQFSDVEVVIASTDTTGLQLYHALQQQGLNIPIFAMGGEAEAQNLMRQGKAFSTFDAMLDEASNAALNLALNLARGKRAEHKLNHSIENRSVFVPPLELEEAHKRRERQKSTHTDHKH